jgi:uncharacterized membrane protein YwzB
MLIRRKIGSIKKGKVTSFMMVMIIISPKLVLIKLNQKLRIMQGVQVQKIILRSDQGVRGMIMVLETSITITVMTLVTGFSLLEMTTLKMESIRGRKAEINIGKTKKKKTSNRKVTSREMTDLLKNI